LICLVAVLSLTGAVQAVVIDDFESYADDAALRAVWNDNNPPATTSVLLTSGGAPTDPMGVQAMRTNYAVPGGWADLVDTSNLAVNDHSGVQRNFGPIDFGPADSFTFALRVQPGWDLRNGNYYLIEYGGDQYAQTWIPCQGQLNPWWEPYPELPAVLVNDDWVNPGNLAGITANTKIISPDDGWVEVTVTDAHSVPWGKKLSAFAAMNSIDLQLWTAIVDKSGASGAPRVDSTGGTHWPAGPMAGTVDFDYLQYVPEPATIAMLGLGGLALIRRKK
jgi:hypothetical protein